jgi:hypothetical protein
LNIAPCLRAPDGRNKVNLRAIQRYSSIWWEGVPDSAYTVQLARRPDPSAILAEFHRSGAGCGMLLHVEPLDPLRVTSDREISGEALGRGGPLLRGATSGKRPGRFPVMTQCASVSSFFSPATVGNEVELLSAMGFNSIGVAGYDPVYFANGFTKLMGSDGAIESGLAGNIVAFGFMDEPSSVPWEDLVASTNYRAAFHAYLAESGLTPSFFAAADWDGVLPTTNKAASPRAFYHTVKFRGRVFTDQCRPGTQALLQKLPSALNAANFNEVSTFYGNALVSGIDIFDTLGPRQGFTLGWTEDWLNWSVTYQLCGYRADFLRAACRPCGRPFGMYCVWRSPWDIEAKAACIIGHGATRLYYYSYGPRYSGMDGASDSYDTYPALRRVNYAIGAVEDFLADALPAPSRIALLHADATDVWTLDQENSVFGKDRMGLYLLLTHLGYPVDLVTEDEAAAGKLSAYSMVFCDGSHLRRDAVAPLLAWLKRGGVLYVGPGSLARDEYDAPLDVDRQVGIRRSPFALERQPGREIYDFPTLPDLAPVHAGEAVFESLCGYQGLVETGSVGTVRATFEDGSPAVVVKNAGRGKLVFCGFFPGLAYQKLAMIAKQRRDAAGRESTTYGSTDYPAPLREFIGGLAALAAVEPPVRTSHYLLEARRLDGPSGTVITLSNWTGAALKNAQVSFARNGRAGTPALIANGVGKQVEKDGIVTLTFDMETPADFVVLPDRGNGGEGQR